MKYYYSFFFFQPFKNRKFTLSSQAKKEAPGVGAENWI